MAKRMDFEVVDHGVEHAQYWQGAGVVNTIYSEIVTGVGDSAHAAGQDAIEQFFQVIDRSEVVAPDVERLAEHLDRLDRTEDACPEDADSEVTHFVSIRWRTRAELGHGAVA